MRREKRREDDKHEEERSIARRRTRLGCVYRLLLALSSFKLTRRFACRKIIGAVIDSIPDLANVIVLLCFMLLIFSIAGLVFWNGILHARCRLVVLNPPIII